MPFSIIAITIDQKLLHRLDFLVKPQIFTIISPSIMKILIAKTAGFCMGVRRAVEMVLEAPTKYEKPIFTYGPLIHNPHVLNLLKEKSISVINEIPDNGTGTVLIRAHGVPPQAKERLKRAGFKVIDATCPRVIKVQTIIRKYAEKGYTTIIIGDKNHPEVIGLLGYAQGKGYIVDKAEAFDNLPSFDKAVIVAQTTQNTAFFKQVEYWAAHKFPNYKIFNTICDSTAKRQAEVKRLTKFTDAIVVVGGKNSGNTRRLAEIAKESGKPVYSIESEEDLDSKTLAQMQCVGITAGASTPNWIIKRVYRAIERLPFRSGRSWRKTFFAIQQTLLLTNIYVSFGAGCLCYALANLQGITNYFSSILVSILYVQSMHILNNLTGSKSDKYNDPDRAFFYNKHKIFLVVLATIAGSMGLITAYIIGHTVFWILFVMSAMGLSYNFKLLPKFIADGKYRRIRDISGSKTILIAVAWGIVTSLLPSLSDGQVNFRAILIFLCASCVVFVRTAFFDILDVQGDKIVGKETIPILLGEKSTMKLLKIMLIIIFIALTASSALHFISSLGYALAICPIFLLIIFNAHERGYMLAGIRLEFLIETHFVLAGIITFLWSILLSP